MKVTGWLDDIRDAYNQASVFIAPMRIGTGLQNKLLEAMAMKLPCITTPLANNALKAKEGKEILIGTSAQELATHITTVLQDNEKAGKLSENGQIYVRSNFSWEHATGELANIIESNNIR